MIRNDLLRRALPGAMLAATLAVPADASAAAGQRPLSEQLASAYAAARHLPAGAIAGLRPGSLRVGQAAGASWAIASFVPAARTAGPLRNGFQDGQGTGVFTRSGSSSWRLVRTGLYGCAAGLPASLRRSWRLGDASSCRAHVANRHRTANGGTPDGQRIADIALSEVGVSTNPAVSNFDGVNCNPFSTMVGAFSANDNGCGPDARFGVQDANETWCADFAKWVWQQAGITADMNMLNAGAVSFYAWGRKQGEKLAPGTGTPRPGDAIVFFPPGKVTQNEFADHVGLVTSVYPDGTIDMVNGDFTGPASVSVQHDTGINLATWPSKMWNPGEQWVIVTPPATAQPPVPEAWLAGPHTAVTGTTARFTARAAGPIRSYSWTFGDGRSTNATGARVSHVYAQPGRYTVTLTVTSPLGTVRTKTANVRVLGTSSPVASAASDAVWYASTPTRQWLFVRSGADRLAADASDGLSWLQFEIPGHLSERTGLTALSYPDPAADYAMTPHAYYRSATGALAQTYLGADGWVTQQLAGHPAADSAIVATSTPAGPEVFYFTADGRLAESAQRGTSWVTSAVSGPATSDLGALAIADTTTGPVLFYRDANAGVVADTPGRSSLPVATSVAAGGPLAAVTTPSGQASVYFTDQAGRLATVTPGGAVAELPGNPAGGSLFATTYLRAGGALGTEVFYQSADGQLAVSYDDGSGWRAAGLPAGTTATALIAANAYQVAGQPTKLFAQTASGPYEYQAAWPSSRWSAQRLPAAPATFDDQVLLYAATPADAQSAQVAAAVAGLPASQVTRSYAVAWDAVLSGSYLVIAVGLPAANALFRNPCKWVTPAGDDGGTPFAPAPAPLSELPPRNGFEAAAAAKQTPQYAIDVAYYATHGTLPPGVTTLPTRAQPTRACSGTPG